MDAHTGTSGDQREAKELGYLWPLGIVAAALVVFTPLEHAVAFFTDGFVRVNLSIEGASITLATPGGTETPLTGGATILVAGEQLPTGSLVLLITAQLLGALLSVAAVGLLILFARSIAKGDFFGRRSLRLLDWASVLIVAALAAPGFLELLGTNWAIASLGWAGADAPEPTVLEQAWSFLLVVVILLVVNLIMRRGARLQRDQEGLV